MSEKTPLASPARSNRKVENKDDKPRVRLSQQVIITTAADLFARNGFGATSLDDIGEALGVTKGALYYHIKNKEEILKLIFMTVLAVSEEPLRQIARAEISPADKLKRAITHHAAVAADRSPAMQVFYREDVHLTGPFAREIATRKKAYERLFEEIIEEGIQVGQFRQDIDPKIAAFGILGMCNWLSQWYRPGRAYSPQQIAAFFSRLAEFGLVLPEDK